MTLPTEETHINLDNKKKHVLIAIIKRYGTNEGLDPRTTGIEE